MVTSLSRSHKPPLKGHGHNRQNSHPLRCQGQIFQATSLHLPPSLLQPVILSAVVRCRKGGINPHLSDHTPTRQLLTARCTNVMKLRNWTWHRPEAVEVYEVPTWLSQQMYHVLQTTHAQSWFSVQQSPREKTYTCTHTQSLSIITQHAHQTTRNNSEEVKPMVNNFNSNLQWLFALTTVHMCYPVDF